MTIKKKGTNMKFNFSDIKLEIVDLNTNSNPDMFINQYGISFSKRILEDLSYPQFVQYCVNADHKIFAIRACKGTEAKATPFSKSKTEQTKTITCNNKNLREVILTLIPKGDSKQRYKVTGEYDAEKRTMYFDMNTAEVSSYHRQAAE